MVPLGCYPNWDSIDCGVRRNTLAHPNTFIVPGSRAEGVRVQCGVPVVGLSDQPGQQVFVPVLDVVVSKPIASKLGGGKAPRLSEVHCDRDSVCVKTDT